MSSFRLILRSLTYHWRLSIAVALGVAVATAVLAGALLVGDSMRASLRELVVERLGRIDQILVADHFFRSGLADEIAATDRFAEDFTAARPAIVLEAAIEHQDASAAGRLHRAGHVTVLGTGAWFWEWGRGVKPESLPGDGQIVLNRPLAETLAAGVGDEVIVRLARPGSIPADSPLGKKTGSVRSRRLKVVAIVPARGLGRFGLRFSQQLPLNAYLATETLQSILAQDDKVNAILIAGKLAKAAAPQAAERRLAESIHPLLVDFGLSIRHVERRFEGTAAIDYYDLTSDRMILPRPVQQAALRSFADISPQPALTYLANDITTAGGKARIPYSTLTGIDSTAALGPLDVDIHGRPIGQIADDEIVLNQWAADDLRQQMATAKTGRKQPGDPASSESATAAALKVGDQITITYFEPESIHGTVRERRATLRLKAIAPLAPPGERPLRTNDPDLTPEVPGVTDEQSLANWDPPFPYDPSRVRIAPPKEQDEDYWEAYRTTPKAFISLATARRLWSSRFGESTSIRVPPAPERTIASLAEQLRHSLDPAQLGFVFRPVKRLGLEAASGNTPFEWLFLGLSMFLIAAAVMLVALLFQLGVQRRLAEIGLLFSVGMRQRQVRSLMGIEGAIVATVGGAIGIAGGGAFAWAILTALESPHWWLGAIGTPFLRLSATPRSLAIGYLVGVTVSLTVIVWGVRATGRVPVRQLLGGQAEPAPGFGRRPASRVMRWLPVIMLILALAFGLLAIGLGGDAQAGAFFGSGGLVLVGALALAGSRLRSETTRPLIAAGGWPLARLAWRNAARHPSRSLLTIGLVAVATFLIVAMSAFRLEPSLDGAGGFDLIAESDAAIHQDLSSPDGRDDLGFSTAAEREISESHIFSLRLEEGDDASCLNLYQAQQPRVAGVPQTLIDRGGFLWAGSAAESPAEQANPWLLLNKQIDARGSSIPVVIDHDTALYSLHLWSGVGEQLTMADQFGHPVTLEVVGLLAHSIFQGEVLIAESAFTRLFPDTSGFRLFLIDTPPDQLEPVAKALDDQLGDTGFHAVSTAERLARLLEIQNTYLSAFQSLGALGLILGTFGLATVQLQNVLERRGELALLRATGFRRWRLVELVMLENVFLLLGGLGIGVLAALVAILPHWLLGGASIPWGSLLVILTGVVVTGMGVGLLTARSVLKAPLADALRGD